MSTATSLLLKKGPQELEHLVVPGAALQPPSQALNKPTIFYKDFFGGLEEKDMIILTQNC